MAAAIDAYLGDFSRQSGIWATLSLPPGAVEDLMPADIDVQLMRVTQEALTNEREHAGATAVEVRLGLRSRRLS